MRFIFKSSKQVQANRAQPSIIANFFNDSNTLLYALLEKHEAPRRPKKARYDVWIRV